MALVALRGAVGVETNSREAILAATRELLSVLIERNRMGPGDILSAIFSSTRDLDAAYPAEAARALGWTDAALLCVQEMGVAGSIPRVIRVLIHADLPEGRRSARHVYLGRAEGLRPDRVQGTPT